MAEGNRSEADLLLQYEGQIVPRSFNAGFVALSYVVSLIGALSTLELINRRTSPKGKFNHLLLMGSAVTMGGIAIWCMHYIGNRAIELADGAPMLQIAYSSGFTALSFFIPILVLVVAFIAVGTQDSVSWWRVTSGGALAGTAICGMHYLGNASIYNYKCVYNPVNVAGAAIIAVVASIVALFMFFVFRAAWANAWWKRLASAMVLGGAVSGMHWCAATGTHYRLLDIHPGDVQLSRNSTVIIVICLSVGACFVMALTAVYTARLRKRYASKAQQVVLAAAVFDKQGRILVSPDGLLPSEMITDTFLEKNTEEPFNTSHRLFHWMFQASRNWSGISPLIDGMMNHLAQLPRHGRDRDARVNIKLVSEHGELIDKYDIIFRELFCAAAVGLAEKVKGHLTNVGILWDEILATGAGGHFQQPQQNQASSPASEVNSIDRTKSSDVPMVDMEKGVLTRKQEYGRGSLMFLVREVNDDRDIDNLCAAGYRFAPPHQVSGIIASTMQIKSRNFESKLLDMSRYAKVRSRLPTGVHVGFFGIRARVGSLGFDVLVRKESRDMLPTKGLPLDRLEPWHMDFLRRMDKMTVAAIERKVLTWKNVSPKETEFAQQLVTAIQELGTWIEDRVFNEATLTPKVINLPRRATDTGSITPSAGPLANTMIVLKLVIPIHVNVISANCDFIPLNFFKVHQLSDKASPHHGTFVRSVHRELAPVINSVPIVKAKSTSSGSKRGKRIISFPHKLRKLRDGGSNHTGPVDSDGNPIPTVFGRAQKMETASNQSSSTLKLWRGPASDMLQSPGSSQYETPSSPTHHHHATEGNKSNTASMGGIMVSQEITVDVHDMSEAASPPERVVVVRPLQRRPSQGTALAADGDEISPRDMTSEGLVPHAGVGIRQIANIEVERFNEVATFVDELFAICVDNR